MADSRSYSKEGFFYAGGNLTTVMTFDGSIFEVENPGLYLVVETDDIVVHMIIDCREIDGKSVTTITGILFTIQYNDLPAGTSLEIYLKDSERLHIYSIDELNLPKTVEEARQETRLGRNIQVEFLGK